MALLVGWHIVLACGPKLVCISVSWNTGLDPAPNSKRNIEVFRLRPWDIRDFSTSVTQAILMALPLFQKTRTQTLSFSLSCSIYQNIWMLPHALNRHLTDANTVVIQRISLVHLLDFKIFAGVQKRKGFMSWMLYIGDWKWIGQCLVTLY